MYRKGEADFGAATTSIKKALTVKEGCKGGGGRSSSSRNLMMKETTTAADVTFG